MRNSQLVRVRLGLNKLFVFYIIVLISLKGHTMINQWLNDNLKDYELYYFSSALFLRGSYVCIYD